MVEGAAPIANVVVPRAMKGEDAGAAEGAEAAVAETVVESAEA
jgi:hypothetical protein